jgi:GNAT superfamily N-acetyltransferase
MVAVVHVRGQERGRLGVGARDEHGRHAADVGGEPRGDQLVDRFLRRHQHLAAHVAALLRARELVLEVHAGRPRVDHRLHELEGVQHAAEACFGIGDDGLQPVHLVVAFGVADLVGAQQRVVDAPDHRGHGVGRVQRLVRVHLAGEVCIARDLPAGQVDRLEAGTHLLHGLVAGERAERVHERQFLHVPPQLLGAEARQRMLDVHRAAQTRDVRAGVAARDPLPARALLPMALDLCRRLQGHVRSRINRCLRTR